MSTEARELELCGKVEMRIALAKDDKLEALLKTYLSPLLLKLGSEYPAVRNKVSVYHHHVIYTFVDSGYRLWRYVSMLRSDLQGTGLLKE